MALASANATQQFVPVKEIRNGVIILKDSSYRGVLICSAINFGLKSTEEQHAIILGFQNFPQYARFLNSNRYQFTKDGPASVPRAPR